MKYLLFIFCAFLFISCGEEPGKVIGVTEDDKPEFEILYPAQMDTLTHDFNLRIKGSDFSGIKAIYIKINSNTYQLGVSIRDSVDIDFFSPGLNKFSVYMIDNYGNVSDTKTLDVFVMRIDVTIKPLSDIDCYYNGGTIETDIADVFKFGDYNSSDVIKSVVSYDSGLLSCTVADNKTLVIQPLLNKSDVDFIIIKGTLGKFEATAKVFFHMDPAFYIPSKSLYEALGHKVGNQYVSDVSERVLYLSNKNITSTEGIESFQHLYELDLSDNLFSSLNLQKQQSFGVLKINNSPVETILFPDKNTLERIELSSTKITSLNFTSKEILTSVILRNNPLEHLILPDILYYSCTFSVNNNKIKTLDFNNIKSVRLYADFSSNEIETVNLRQAAFRALDLSNNKIREIEFSPANTENSIPIYLQNNNLQSLDLRAVKFLGLYTYSNPDLKEIYITKEQEDLIKGWQADYLKIDPWTRLVVLP